MYHQETGEENQDITCYRRNRRFAVISLADGVSTCKSARIGAEITCRSITDLLFEKGLYFFEFEPFKTAEWILSHILYRLKQRAEKDSQEVNEYSSTAAAVLVDKLKGRMLCLNLGDGIIIAAGQGHCRVVSMPSDTTAGCCVTTTHGASLAMSVKTLNTDLLSSVVICSDGSWREMFPRGKLMPEIATLLGSNNFTGLKKYLTQQNTYDDCSFIALSLAKRRQTDFAML